MFKFLERKKEIPIQVEVKELVKPSIYSKEIQAIHSEFDTASDRLVKEARNIINNPSEVNINKIELLSSLGFIQASEVEKGKDIIKEIKLSKHQISLIQLYSIKYPNQKFITDHQVQLICHKYNLVCGTINRFKGFVPDKNLKEIFDFKSKNKQINVITCIDKKGNSIIIEAEIRITNGYAHIYKVGETDNYRHAYQADSSNYNRFYSNDNHNLFPELQDINGFTVNNTIITDLSICAPVKDMDISGLELVEGYKLVKKHIPDPIVLQPVSGGYLILTAWGDEASDPLVINEKNN